METRITLLSAMHPRLRPFSYGKKHVAFKFDENLWVVRDAKQQFVAEVESVKEEDVRNITELLELKFKE